MAKIIVEIADESLKYALNRGAKVFGKKAKQFDDELFAKFLVEMGDDVANYLANDLTKFFEDGINNDLYEDFLEDLK
jgi:hypothetical protein